MLQYLFWSGRISECRPRQAPRALQRNGHCEGPRSLDVAIRAPRTVTIVSQPAAHQHHYSRWSQSREVHRATELALPAVPLGSHLGVGQLRHPGCIRESAAKTAIGGRTAMSRRPPAGPSVSGGESIRPAHHAVRQVCRSSSLLPVRARRTHRESCRIVNGLRITPMMPSGSCCTSTPSLTKPVIRMPLASGMMERT